MLALYEIFFENPVGTERDRQLLLAILENFGADQGIFLAPSTNGEAVLKVATTAKPWRVNKPGDLLENEGVGALLELQALSPVSLSLTRVSRPSAFELESWEAFWEHSLKGAASSLLSVSVKPSTAPSFLLWILQTEYSREWNIRDRELAEEVAGLMAKVADRDMTAKASP